MNRIQIVVRSLLLLNLLSASAIGETINGFVTDVQGANRLRVGEAQVILNAQTVCETETAFGIGVSPSLGDGMPSALYLLRQRAFSPAKTSRVPCAALHVAVGSRVHIVGQNKSPGAFVASTLVAYQVKNEQTLSGTALLEETPARNGPGRSHAQMWIDGYKIGITPATRIELSSKLAPASAESLIANHSVSYTAVLAPNGTWTATSILEYDDRRGDIDLDEDEDTSDIPDVTVEPQDCGLPAAASNRAVQFDSGTAIDVLPNEQVHEFVSKVGASVIPEYEQQLPKGDPGKIHFRFCVVQASQLASRLEIPRIDGSLPHEDINQGFDNTSPSRKQQQTEIIVLPTGLILIPDEVLTNLDDTAQLTALLSYAVAAILQGDIGMAWDETHDGDRTYGHVLVLQSRNRRDIEKSNHMFQVVKDIKERILRIGIRQMYCAGYDIREAPLAWAVSQGKVAGKIDIGSSRIEVNPWYAAYAYDYISQFYSDVDYSKLKRGDKEYDDFLSELRKADPEAFTEGK